MTSTLAGEARQADWIEQDSAGRDVLCVTNTVRLVNPRSVCFLGGSQDRPEQGSDWHVLPDWSVLVNVSIGFELRERPEILAFETEHVAFQAILPHVRALYGGQFVAVHGGSVVDSDASRETLLKRFFARYGDVPVYIGYVGELPVAYQVTPFQT